MRCNSHHINLLADFLGISEVFACFVKFPNCLCNLRKELSEGQKLFEARELLLWFHDV